MTPEEYDSIRPGDKITSTSRTYSKRRLCRRIESGGPGSGLGGVWVRDYYGGGSTFISRATLMRKDYGLMKPPPLPKRIKLTAPQRELFHRLQRGSRHRIEVPTKKVDADKLHSVISALVRYKICEAELYSKSKVGKGRTVHVYYIIQLREPYSW